MLFRSSNNKFTHFQGDVLSNVDDSSHGVQLAGGSTGGIVQPCGDEDNIALTVRGKGTGGVNVGNSSQTVTLAGPLSVTGAVTSTGASSFTGAFSVTSTQVNITSTKVFIGAAGSTSFLIGIRKVFVEFTVPVMAVNAGAEVGDIAVTGLTTNAVVTLAPRGALNSTVAGVIAPHAFCSTAGQLHITLQNAGTTISGSTQSAYAMIHEFGIPVP